MFSRNQKSQDKPRYYWIKSYEVKTMFFYNDNHVTQCVFHSLADLQARSNALQTAEF